MSNSTVARPVTKFAGFVNQFQIAAESTGQTDKRYPLHVFTMRPAPAQSPLAGQWFCEIHCSNKLWASNPLTENELSYESFEQVTIGSWKLLRFRCTKASALKLSEMCAKSDLESRRLLTNEGFRNWSQHFKGAVTTAHKF